HLNTLRKSILMLEEHPASPEVFVESNRLFHQTLAVASGNPYIQAFLPEFFGAEAMSHAAGTAGPVQRSFARFFHSRIADAVARREGGCGIDGGAPLAARERLPAQRGGRRARPRRGDAGRPAAPTARAATAPLTRRPRRPAPLADQGARPDRTVTHPFHQEDRR